ncbi:hypothetical protein RBSH_02813 [Rhodopirellula baltica SH28]|uniref:Uncharacterized protein n=1 Tax=Rhodopirellula baltica SH28 TaxID=993517 RepID=K5E7U9_RHOBT|nr:hypothetical protein RBSH_02813 [Rhodopirellula baltica SH28]
MEAKEWPDRKSIQQRNKSRLTSPTGHVPKERARLFFGPMVLSLGGPRQGFGKSGTEIFRCLRAWAGAA